MEGTIPISPYYVWKRNPDGYISSSCGRFPQGWTNPDGTKVTFELLGEFTEWFGSDGAHQFLKTKIKEKKS